MRSQVPRSTPNYWMSALSLVLAALSSLGAETRPNLIFFLSDDQRADFMGCAGHPILKTPTMDRLAASGVRFENMFVTTSICAASRASIFTGLHERTHGYTFRTPPIGAAHTRLSYPALLRAAGYRTGFVGKFGVAVEAGERESMFDVFVPLGRSPYLKPQPDGSRRHVSEIAGDRAIEFLRSTPDDRPFCLSVSFNAPHAEDGDKKNHYPWPKAVDGWYDDVPIPRPRLEDTYPAHPEFLKKSLNRVRWFWRWDTPEKYERNVRSYYRMISGIDHVMGRVLAEVEASGRAEDTVVVFSGDNGYYRGDRGFAGKWSHYEESLRVPLIVFDPRLPPAQRGRVVSATTLNLDIPATLLAYAGIEVPTSYRGASLRPWIDGERPPQWRRDFFCEHLMEHAQIPKYEGVRGERYVYARYFEQQPTYEYLHDLRIDPDQRRNFAGDPEYSSILARFRARCDELRDEYGGVYDPNRVREFIERREAQRKRAAEEATKKKRDAAKKGQAKVENAPRSAVLESSVRLRGNFARSARRFRATNRGHVAFMGGSITEMNGYRPLVAALIEERFPETTFTFTNAGIASTCSTTGAFRLGEDVLAKGPVDLFLVEFAVNDDQDAEHAARACLRGMEGIVRQVRRHNPESDIAIVHFVNPEMLAAIARGEVPVSSRSHERVAAHYGLASIDVGRELAQRIEAGSFTWKDYGGTHPGRKGNEFAASLVRGLLDEAWGTDDVPATRAPRLDPLDRGSYDRGRFISLESARPSSGWSILQPRWEEIPGRCRERFRDQNLLVATDPGSELELEFEGRAVGAYVLAGPDAGTVAATVDGRDTRIVDLYHRFSRGLHYPRTVLFADDLTPGKHVLGLRVTPTKNAKSSGHAIRILRFTAN